MKENCWALAPSNGEKEIQRVLCCLGASSSKWWANVWRTPDREAAISRTGGRSARHVIRGNELPPGAYYTLYVYYINTRASARRNRAQRFDDAMTMKLGDDTAPSSVLSVYSSVLRVIWSSDKSMKRPPRCPNSCLERPVRSEKTRRDDSPLAQSLWHRRWNCAKPADIRIDNYPYYLKRVALKNAQRDRTEDAMYVHVRSI